MACENLVVGELDDHLGRASWRTYLKCADMLEEVGL